MTRFLLSLIFIISFILITTNASAQTDNDLYLFSIEKSGKGEYHVHSPKFLSTFNKRGYTNQPSFTPSGDLLVSVRKEEDTQNDIWQLSLASKKYRRLTRTDASEYSPRIHPDEENLTVLRKINGDPINQQVCNIDLRSGEMTCVAEELHDIGYYTWISMTELGLFRIEGTTNRLSYYNTDDKKSRRITTSIGRTLLSDKSGAVIYIHKFTDAYWYIKKYNPTNSAIEIVTQTVAKNEDFALAPDGTYFMGKDNLLFVFNSAIGKDWKQIADLSIYGIKYITRMAISPDGKKLAIVAT
ncbi:MAG TPA: hypothetical protein VMZ69_01125, partial [Saprospiraceae bacterium]|nr:hypothetical protein [Saprospiraceae bacterium]